MAWKPVIQFRPFGTPRPGGSKTAFRNPHTGKLVVTESCKKNPAWRQDVKQAAIQAVGPGTRLLDGCLFLDVTFYLERPHGHFRSGRNGLLLKDSAPPFPNVMPDVTKLVRSIEDALTGILWTDDARITDQAVRKRYCAPGQAPGADISISVWEREPGAVRTTPAVTPLFEGD